MILYLAEINLEPRMENSKLILSYRNQALCMQLILLHQRIVSKISFKRESE